ncbi:MAG: FecR family protein [Alphaproteobacteria bacterium]|nr:FecR family protein [Alphaproteobacteria bacterium]MDP6515636.1 FecR family protein [Alphaproteobacteria bacterium]
MAPGDPVHDGDLLATGPGARLAARLDDGTEITLGENAELLIDEFVYEAGSRGNLFLKVLKGAFLFIGGAIEEIMASNVAIDTPAATLGIRGTTVWGGPIDDGYGVLVQDGRVAVTTDRRTVVLGPGEATMIAGRDSAPEAPHTWSAEKTARAVAAVSFAE